MSERERDGAEPRARGLARLMAFAPIVLVLVALTVHVVSLMFDRVFDNVDLRTHFQWSVQVQQAWADGTFYPRWMPKANGGLGEPAFVIMHPGWYWVVAGFNLVGLDTWWAMRLAAFASTLVTGLAVYLVLRRRLPDTLALVAAVLSQTAPFASFLFGFHAALPWQFSLLAATLVLIWSVDDGARRPGPALAAAVGCLCITHLLVTFMMLLCVGAVRLIEAVLRRQPALMGRWVSVVLLGLGCATLYWLLAATSKPLFVVGAPGDDIYINWRNSFVWPVVTSGMYGTRWPLVQWVLPLVPLAALAVTGWLLFSTPKLLRDARWTSALRLFSIGVFALMMSSEIAYPAYATVHFLTNVQWPYRFLTVASLTAPLAMAMAMAPNWDRKPLNSRHAVFAAAAAVSLLMLLVLQVKQYREGDQTGMGAPTLAGRFGQPGALPLGVGPSWRDYLQQGGLTADCALKGWQCKQTINQAHLAEFNLVGSSPLQVRLPRFAFPAWSVKLDGQEIVPGRDADTGLMTIDLQPGQHLVQVYWSPLWQERVGLPISALSLAVLLGWAVWRRSTPGVGVA